MINKLRARFTAFMRGRYGIDRLGTVLLWTCIGISVINILVSSSMFYALQTALLIWVFFRFFSRNISRRYSENAAFMRIISKIKMFFKLRFKILSDRKTHVYKKCPHCKATLRLPLSKGRHTVRCPHCSQRFEVKI